MTIHLPSNLPADVLERIVGFIHRQKVSFQLDTSPYEGATLLDKNDPYYEVALTGRNKTWSDDPETRTIQSRLHEKYVVTGEWDKMDDDERQDTVLGEMMVYNSEQPGYGEDALSAAETDSFIQSLKNGTL